MKQNLLIAALVFAGVSTAAVAQTTVNLTVNGSTQPATLNSFSFSGGTLNVDVNTTDSGGGDGGGTTDPATYTLTVSSPQGGSIVDVNGVAASAGSVLSGNYVINSGTSIALSLQAASGYLASSWSGACNGTSASQNCTVTMGSNQTVGASFQLESSGNCPAPGSNVSVVSAGVGGQNYNTSVLSRDTSKDRIWAYSFTTPSSGTTLAVTATRASGGEGKYVVITECPGDISNPVMRRCEKYSSESTKLTYDTRSSPYFLNCALETGKTYYANVVNKSSFYDPPTCTSNCGFLFQKD